MWIYLSPHFDDAAFSCGGLVWEQTHAEGAVRTAGGASPMNGVALWTVCAGDIPPGPLSAFAQSLHARWSASGQGVNPRKGTSPRQGMNPRQGTGPRQGVNPNLGNGLQPGDESPAGDESSPGDRPPPGDEDFKVVERRRSEDLAACAELSASYRHFTIPDCIYRGAGPGPQDLQSRVYFYASEGALFGPLHPAETPLVESLARALRAALPAGAQVVCPLGLGNHVDHQLTRRAAESLGLDLWYYPDFPYTRQDVEELERLVQSGWQPVAFPVSPAGLEAWCRAVAAHRSQISTFWPDLEAMWRELHAYSQANGGVVLWRRDS